MRTVEIEVLQSQAALQAFKKAWREAERGEEVVPRIGFGSWAEVFSAITEKRLEIIGFVLEHKGLNTRQIAKMLGRDYKNVYMDVQALVEVGLLDKDSRGRISAPFDEIVIRAELRDATKHPLQFSMTKAEAIRLFGGVGALARAVEVTSQAVSQWPDGEIDEPRRSQITLLAMRRGLIPPVEAGETTSSAEAA